MHLAIALVTAVIFLIDLQLPLGVAVSQLYVIPVLLALWSPIPRLPFIIAAIGTTLSIVDLPLSPVGGHWFGLISKPLSWLIGIARTCIADHQSARPLVVSESPDIASAEDMARPAVG